MRIRRSRTLNARLAVTLSAVLLMSLLSGLFASSAGAETSRTARVEQVTGTVHITKAGGSHAYRAFKGMSLNLGDHISTEADSSLVLTMVGREDEVTVGENSNIYISELAEENGGTQTGLSMWSGSVWVKAQKLAGNDEFTVETPTAVMGIRGTQFFTGVDSETGDATISVGAGVVQAEIHNNSEASNGQGNDQNNEPGIVFIYPTMQAEIYTDPDTGNSNSIITPIDPDSFVDKASPAVIEAMIRHKKEADKENQQFLEQQKRNLNNNDGLDGNVRNPLGITNEEDLNRINHNLKNMIGNIVNQAIDKGQVDKDKVQEIIDEVNKNLDEENKIDLDTVEPPQLTDEQKQRLEQLKKLQEEQKRRQEELRKKQEEMKERNRQLLNKLEEQREKQNRENQKALTEKENQKKDEFLDNLSDEQRKQFEERKKRLEERKQEQNNRADSRKKTDRGNSGNTDDSSDSDSTSEPLAIDHVEDMYCIIFLKTDGQQIEGADPQSCILKNGLPTHATAHMNDGSIKQVKVQWQNGDETPSCDFGGTCVIHGHVIDDNYNGVVSVYFKMIFAGVEPGSNFVATMLLAQMLENEHLVYRLQLFHQSEAVQSVNISCHSQGCSLVDQNGDPITDANQNEGCPNALSAESMQGTLEGMFEGTVEGLFGLGYKFCGLQEGEAYSVHVEVWDSEMKTLYGHTEYPVITLHGIPGLELMNTSTSSIRIGWEPLQTNQNVSYQAYLVDKEAGKVIASEHATQNLEVEFNGLADNTTYLIRVEAKGNDELLAVSEITATTVNLPDIQNLTVTGSTYHSISVQWDAYPDTYAYRVDLFEGESVESYPVGEIEVFAGQQNNIYSTTFEYSPNLNLKPGQPYTIMVSAWMSPGADFPAASAVVTGATKEKDVYTFHSAGGAVYEEFQFTFKTQLNQVWQRR